MHISAWLCQLSSSVTNPSEKQIRGKVVFCLTASELSVHGHLALLPLAHLADRTPWEKGWETSTAHLISIRKRRVRDCTGRLFLSFCSTCALTKLDGATHTGECLLSLVLIFYKNILNNAPNSPGIFQSNHVEKQD